MISVCFITKNEEKWIGECISHLQPIVKEFILLDTGSTDRTVDIAKQNGAIVHHMIWPNDFSAARNESLKFATQPWILKIDPDERLDPKDFSRLLQLTQTDLPAYQFWTRAYTNDTSRVTLLSYQLCKGEYPEREKGYRGFITYPNIRLFKNSPSIRYVGKIHESVEPTLPGYQQGVSTPVPAPLDIYFHHYGHTDSEVKEKQKSPLYAKLIREEIERNPNNWYVLFELGIEEFQNGNFEAAAKSFEKANQAHPKKTQVLSNLGLSYLQLQNFEAAEKTFKECLSVDPNYHDAALNLGICYLEKGDFRAGVQSLDHCLRMNPKSFLALRAKGQAVAKIGDLKSAELFFRQALEIMPPFVEAKVDLAIVLLEVQRKDEAKNLLKQVLKEDFSNPRASFILKKLDANN